jgi:two-component system, chemotaxis family, sensor kinase CheA
MDIDPDIYKQLLETFKSELDELVQSMQDHLMRIDELKKADERKPVVDELFRAAHTIKGSARSLEIDHVADIAHAVEDLFSLIRQSGAPPSREVIDAGLESADAMLLAFSDFVDGKALSVDKAALLKRFDKLIKLQAEPQEASKERESSPPEKEAEPISKTPSSDKKTPPSKEDAADEKNSVADEKTSSAEELQLNEYIKVPVEKLTSLTSYGDQIQAFYHQFDFTNASLNRILGRLDEVENLHTRLKAHLDKLDDALVTHDDKKLALDVSDILTESKGAMTKLTRFYGANNHQLYLSTMALQECVRSMRLVPVAGLLTSLKRTAREISFDLGKKVSFISTGDEVSIDRVVLDKIKDPLMHILRNAIDHGLENPKARKLQKKDEVGSIELTVSQLGEQIVFQVTDDGEGIDVEKVAETAIQKHIITREERAAYTDKMLLDFIFSPGFSTKQMITDLSGRGVGLDVVRTNLQEVKGEVSVETTKGKGSVFTLKVPLTLLTDRALFIEVAGQTFALPTTMVKKVVSVSIQDVKSIESGYAFLDEGEPIPLRYLADILALPYDDKKNNDDALLVLIIFSGRQSMGVVIDQVHGEREMVVRPLAPPLQSVRNVAGATLSGDRRIVIVLSASDLLLSSLHSKSKLKMISQKTKRQDDKKTRVLVVDDSITTRTLETNILQTNGYDVTSVVDGEQAWTTIQGQTFDVVVTDVEMPKMNGFELTERIKSSAKFKKIPVVIVTSLSKESEKKRGLKVGANAYIVKSQFESKALLDVIKQVI